MATQFLEFYSSAIIFSGNSGVTLTLLTRHTLRWREGGREGFQTRNASQGHRLSTPHRPFHTGYPADFPQFFRASDFYAIPF